jgi:hypothetical protein
MFKFKLIIKIKLNERVINNFWIDIVYSLYNDWLYFLGLNVSFLNNIVNYKGIKFETGLRKAPL